VIAHGPLQQATAHFTSARVAQRAAAGSGRRRLRRGAAFLV